MWKTPEDAAGAEFTEIDEKTQRTPTAKKGRGGVGSFVSQRCGLALHAACSACAGDYEDPERSAAPEEFPSEEYEGEHEAATTADEKTGAQ